MPNTQTKQYSLQEMLERFDERYGDFDSELYTRDGNVSQNVWIKLFILQDKKEFLESEIERLEAVTMCLAGITREAEDIKNEVLEDQITHYTTLIKEIDEELLKLTT